MELQARELRIGNLLKDRYDIVTVYSITEKGINILPNSNDVYYGFDDVQPIPLTEDWLLRFGFEKEEEHDEGGLVDFLYKLEVSNLITLTSNWDSEEIIYVNLNQCGVDCEFVHQLQNLYFALTGSELTIKETGNV